MARAAASASREVETLLDAHQHKAWIPIVMCGSGGGGRSTLAARLAHELDVAGAPGPRGQDQGTGVTRTHFATATRRFTVADIPGHEAFTRAMVANTSTAAVAVIVVDARRGIVSDIRRHSHLVSLLGPRRVVLAVNKMDLVRYSADVFTRLAEAYTDLAGSLGLSELTCIPMSALRGHNVGRRSERTPWYDGPSLLEHLDTVSIPDAVAHRPFRLAVQWTSRHPGGAICGGRVASGEIEAGQRVRVFPSVRESRIARILIGDAEKASAAAGESVSLVFTDELDVRRGDVVASAHAPVGVADQFEATIVWMDEQPLLQGRSYLLKVGAQTAGVTVAPVKYRVNVETLEHGAAKKLDLDDIGVCGLQLDHPIAFEAYIDNPDLGGFILLDRLTKSTVGAGLLHFALRRSENVRWQPFDVDKSARSALKTQKPCVIWFTGLSGAGKSTIANALETRLHALGLHTYTLDGDNVRHGLTRDLGFTDADRVENIRRVGEVSRLMVDAGLIVLVSFISPFRAERRMARHLVGAGEFIEVFVDTPLAVAEGRDPKGLYKKARRGELANFTGVDSPYEVPERPEISIDTTRLSAGEAADTILEHLRGAGLVDPSR